MPHSPFVGNDKGRFVGSVDDLIHPTSPFIGAPKLVFDPNVACCASFTRSRVVAQIAPSFLHGRESVRQNSIPTLLSEHRLLTPRGDEIAQGHGPGRARASLCRRWLYPVTTEEAAHTRCFSWPNETLHISCRPQINSDEQDSMTTQMRGRT